MSTTEKISNLAQLKLAIRRFETVQNEQSSYGAQDTEPCAVFRSILRKAVRGEQVDIPTTGHGWELYASSMDCSSAAIALFQAARAVVEAIQDCPIGQSAEVQKYVKDYCWDD